MQNNVQKKKAERATEELILWEVVTPGRKPAITDKEREQRRKARRRRVYLYRTLAFSVLIIFLIFVYIITGVIYRGLHKQKKDAEAVAPVINIGAANIGSGSGVSGVKAPEIITDLLEINDYSRPGTALKKIKNIFVHYTANPGTSAAQNRSYFANLEETHERSASAHFIIGYEGEIIQCIPLDEQAFAVMTRNEDSISIECCYLDEDGQFTKETYDSLVQLLAWLTQEYDLESEDILRHYDCGGKLCPLYYVDHEDAWKRLIQDVETECFLSAGNDL